jgi:acyl-CoA dehydrogenase
MIAEAAAKLFAADPSDDGWRAAGFGDLLASGGTHAEAHALLFEAGRHAAAPALATHLGANTRFLPLFLAHETAGHLASLLALTLAHTSARTQFGKPLAAQQSVQQSLAALAAEAHAARVAAQSAASVLDSGQDAAFEVPAAALRAKQAARAALAIAHQLHGAIGFTAEHPLAPHSLRLKALQRTPPSEGDFAATIGALVSADPWSQLTASHDKELACPPTP